VTSRGRLVLALAAACYLVAWALGSRPLYPVAVGLALVALLSWAWVRASARPMTLERKTRRRAHTEGEHVPVRLHLRSASRLPPPSVVVVERIGRLGERQTPLDRRRGGYLLDALPRGRYRFEAARAVIEDPFGLALAEVPLEAAGAILVRPRVVPLERLFSEGGSRRAGGNRLTVRRPSGVDVHGVREWGQGESLRHVHWASTAKRGRLMVKELEDSPRDEVAVVLDARGGVAVADSFDVQVRAAAALLRSYATRHREARLTIAGRLTESHSVRTLGADWEAALDALAAVEPDGRTPVEALLEEGGAVAGSREVVIVTATLTRGLADRLVRLQRARRPVSLVQVDAASFAPGAVPFRDPALLRLHAAGVAVAVVRAGDDLRAVLSAPAEAAHG
jgi:uncharacterized protein (DUF58 family)